MHIACFSTHPCYAVLTSSAYHHIIIFQDPEVNSSGYIPHVALLDCRIILFLLPPTFFVILGMEPKALCMLGKYYTHFLKDPPYCFSRQFTTLHPPAANRVLSFLLPRQHLLFAGFLWLLFLITALISIFLMISDTELSSGGFVDHLPIFIGEMSVET